MQSCSCRMVHACPANRQYRALEQTRAREQFGSRAKECIGGGHKRVNDLHPITRRDGAELGHVTASSVYTRQQGQYLRAMGCCTEPCYFGATAYSTEQRVQKQNTSSRGLNVIFFSKNKKAKMPKKTVYLHVLHIISTIFNIIGWLSIEC